jgi:hypothetical protein
MRLASRDGLVVGCEGKDDPKAVIPDAETGVLLDNAFHSLALESSGNHKY